MLRVAKMAPSRARKPQAEINWKAAAVEVEAEAEDQTGSGAKNVARL